MVSERVCIRLTCDIYPRGKLCKVNDIQLASLHGYSSILDCSELFGIPNDVNSNSSKHNNTVWNIQFSYCT